MLELLLIGAAAGGIGAGYVKLRGFVRDRLRFVDAIHKRRAPLVVGTVATLAAGPVVWVLPVIGGGTALAFGIGMGLAVSHGSRDVERAQRSLPY
jgi:hypothetical protein